MLIINADDFGRSRRDTERILQSFADGLISSTTAMAYMEEDERAATSALERDLPVGLHLNFSAPFTSPACTSRLSEIQDRLSRFFRGSRYASVFYNPFIRKDLEYSFRLQLDRHRELYSAEPDHFDGHHHLHLCTNCLLEPLIPSGSCVRRPFSLPPGANPLNRAYRAFAARRVAARYRSTESFYSIRDKVPGLPAVIQLASAQAVEMATHPGDPLEWEMMQHSSYRDAVQSVQLASYRNL